MGIKEGLGNSLKKLETTYKSGYKNISLHRKKRATQHDINRKLSNFDNDYVEALDNVDDWHEGGINGDQWRIDDEDWYDSEKERW